MRTDRDQEGSDTESTDDESGWGGLGMFEYSLKGLPHALMHAPEQLETYGHFGACCTCVAEAGHKNNIKKAARFSRTYGDRNETMDGMLVHVQRQQLWTAIHELNSETTADAATGTRSTPSPASAPPTPNSASGEELAEAPVRHAVTCLVILHKLREPLPRMTDGWSSMDIPPEGRPPPAWGATFLSEKVLITRTELITLLRTKLGMTDTWSNITLLATRVHWACYGCALLNDNDGNQRKVVGISNLNRGRRDFVRLQNGEEDSTALSVQVYVHTRRLRTHEHVYVTFFT